MTSTVRVKLIHHWDSWLKIAWIGLMRWCTNYGMMIRAIRSSLGELLNYKLVESTNGVLEPMCRYSNDQLPNHGYEIVRKLLLFCRELFKPDDSKQSSEVRWRLMYIFSTVYIMKSQLLWSTHYFLLLGNFSTWFFFFLSFLLVGMPEVLYFVLFGKHDV